MKIEKQIINQRCTIFIDKILPFSVQLFDTFKEIFALGELTPVILPDIQTPFLGMQQNQHWGGMDKNNIKLEVYSNKIDFFTYNGDNEAKVCLYFLHKIINLCDSLSIKIRRMAFAPVYQSSEDDVSKFFDVNLKKATFNNIDMHDFSMNRVFYKTEDFEGSSFNIIYNCSVTLQIKDFQVAEPEKKIIIMNDINTRDMGGRVFSRKEIEAFYKKVPERNAAFLKLFLED